MRGDGKLYPRGNKIYVSGSVDGVFYRKSTGKRVSSATLAWIKKADPIEVLKKLIGKENITTESSVSIERFGLKIIELTKSKRGEETQKDYLRILKKKIAPFFDKYGFAETKPIHVVHFLEDMKKEVCGDRARRIKNVLTLIFDYAADNSHVDKINNPVHAKTVHNVSFEYEPENSEAYDFEETALMLKYARGWFKVYLDLSFKLGSRPGELMGLKWEDVDLEVGKIHIKRTVYKGTIKEAKDHRKNKNHNRILFLFPESLELLKTYYEVRPGDEWVFVNKDGSYFKESKTINDYHVKPLLEALKLPYKPLYSARRSYATIMNYAGEDLKDIQETMGHSQGSKITEKHYIDPRALKDQHRQKMAQKSEQLFKTIVDI